MKSTLTALVLGVALLVGGGGVGYTQDNDPVCKELEKMRDSMKFPMQVDHLTSLIDVEIICQKKTLNYIKMLSVEISQFSQGWKARKLQQHHRIHCNQNGLARNYGWVVMDQLNGPNGAWVATFITRPKDCL